MASSCSSAIGTVSRPTDAGVAFLESTRLIVSDLETLFADARIAGRGESGWLRIGLYVSVSAGPLREVIQTYMEQFTGVELRISNGSRHRLMERLNNGALDIVIVVGQTWPGTLQAIPFVVGRESCRRAARNTSPNWRTGDLLGRSAARTHPVQHK